MIEIGSAGRAELAFGFKEDSEACRESLDLCEDREVAPVFDEPSEPSEPASDLVETGECMGSEEAGFSPVITSSDDGLCMTDVCGRPIRRLTSSLSAAVMFAEAL